MERDATRDNPHAPATDRGEPPAEAQPQSRREAHEDAPAESRRLPRTEPPPSSRRSGESRAGFAAKALRGLMWVASTGLGSRIVTLLSTLMLTRYVEPKDYGEVQNTYVVVWMVDLLTQLGIPSYIAGRADISKKHVAHATFFFHVFGFAGMLLCLLLARPLGPHFGAPNMHLYMPGFVLGTLLQRVTTIPDRLLVRDLKFGSASAGRAGGEVVYAVSSLALAMAGTRLDFTLGGQAFVFGGGFAIVWGGIARGLFRVALMLKLVSVRQWFALLWPERQITRDVAAFGVPITMAVLGGIGSRRWDNLAIGNLYGPSTAGIYNFAYNLADVPSQVVGESLGDVLAPSFARTEPAERPKELRRWVGFSALLCFPLGVGLSAVAASLRWMLREEWVSAIPMVLLLGSLSLTRPVINTVYAYLQVLGRTRTLMLLEWARAVGIVAAISVLGRALRAASEPHSEHWGPLLACAAVGVAHLASVLGYQVIAARAGGFPARQLITPLLRPLLACAPMVAAVLLVRLAIGPVESKALLILRLVVEILAGAVIYVGAAWLVAREMVRDFIGLMKTSILKRRSG